MSDPRDEITAPAGRLVVPGDPSARGDADVPADVRDLGSASRSCLAIIAILLALALFICLAVAFRAFWSG